jgi:hypothetical protein
MKVNIEHIKAILNAFTDSDKVFVSLTGDIYPKYPRDDVNDFAFHYLLLIEQGFISNTQLVAYDATKLGYVGINDDNSPSFYNAMIRLTASGVEFAETLNTPSFTERLADFKDQPIEVMKDVGKELITSYLKKKFDIE